MASHSQTSLCGQLYRPTFCPGPNVVPCRLSPLRNHCPLALSVPRLSTAKGRALQVMCEGQGTGPQSDGEASPQQTPSSTSPFAGKKISALLAARRQLAKEQQDGAVQEVSSDAAGSANPGAESVLGGTTLKTPAFSPSVTSVKEAPPATPVPATSAAALQSPYFSKGPSVNAVPATGARPVVSFGRKGIVDALKAEDSAMSSTAALKMTQSSAPDNIFNDPVRTKEQIEAEKFKFEISGDQMLLALSFFGSSFIMMCLVYLVWKLGAIHFNEI